MSLNLKTKALLEANGYSCYTVEHFGRHTKRTHDLLGCMDMVALRKGETLGVQITSHSNHASRRTKIYGLKSALEWVQAGNRLVILSWGEDVEKREYHRMEEIVLSGFAIHGS